MRASVFAALAGFEKPASAYDIADAVSKARGKRRVAANSVYRILDLFVGANLARKRRERERLCRQRASRIAPTTASSWCATRAGRSSHLDDDRDHRFGVRGAAEGGGFRPRTAR